MEDKIRERIGHMKDPVVSNEDVANIASAIALGKKPTDEIVANSDITVKRTEADHSSDMPSVGDELFEDLKTIEDENKQMIENMQNATESAPEEMDLSDLTQADEVAAILDVIESGTDENMVPTVTDEDEELEKFLEKYEENKVFAEIQRNPEPTGPANYIVEVDESFLDSVDSVLSDNNIKFTKVNDKDRAALLEQFTTSGTKVSLALPNSGLYVQFAGAGVDELIAMSKVDPDQKKTEQELTKLSHVVSHITNSTIGKIKLVQLIDIVSYYDIPTLYYGLFAATHPDEIEISRNCPSCGKVYNIKMSTRDLLLNYKDFEKTDEDIRNNVTTYSRFVAMSKLGTVHMKKHSNGMIVYLKHPSIRSFLSTNSRIKPEVISRYGANLSSIAYMITKIAIPDRRPNKQGQYVEYDNPNEIIQIIGSLKSLSDKYELTDIVESLIPQSIPEYGFRETTCPHCGGKNKESEIELSSLLFTLARDEDWLAGARHSIQKKKLQKKG